MGRFAVALVILALSAGFAAGQGAPGPAPTASLPELDASNVVKMLCARQITSRQYLEALLDRVYGEGYACLNAFQYLNVSQALAQADAIDAKATAGESIEPLCGLPLAVKDSTDVKGLPTSEGTSALVGFMPPKSAPLIDNWFAANGIIMGKLALHELSEGGTSVGPTSNNLTSVLNPWNVLHHAGGSSGGSGAALAARLTPVATCEDTGGSCRIPASANGVVGLRTSLGCYDVGDGLLPFGLTRDTIGPMARNMDDLILLDSILRHSNATTRGVHAIPAPGVSCAANIERNFSLEGINIGLPVDYWEGGSGIDPLIMPALEAAMDKMESAGVNLVYINMSDVFTLPGNTYQSAFNFQPAREAARYLYTHNYSLTVNDLYGAVNSPSVFKSVFPSLSQGVDTPEGSPELFFDYIATDRPAFIQAWHDMYEQHSLTAMFWPTAFTETRQIDMVDPNTILGNGSIGPVFGVFGTGDDSNAVQTALTIPLGFSNNSLPVGGNFVMPLGSDGTLLSLGLALEKIFGRAPAPPSPPGCIGCTANVTNQTVTWDGTGPIGANDVWSGLHLKFEGGCINNALNGYGQGVAGMGPMTIASA